MGKTLFRPERGTQRKITATEADAAGLRPGDWFVGVDMDNRTFLLKRGDIFRYGPLTTKVIALDAYFAARRPPPRRIEKPRDIEGAAGPMRKVVSIQEHRWDRMRRIEVLSCDHRLAYLKTDRRRPTRHCRECPRES